jgi:hypothetical protein
MATIINARDVILQAASSRTESIALPSNITVSTGNLVDSAVTPEKTNIPAVNPATGNLADDAFLVTTGYVKASGALLSLVTYAGKYGAATGQFITTGGAVDINEWDIGVWGQLNGTSTSAGKIGVIGIADQANGYGVVGVSYAGKGVYAESVTGYALSVIGKMEITDSTEVSNLNANYVQGVALSGLVRRDQVDIEMSTDNGGSWQIVRFR